MTKHYILEHGLGPNLREVPLTRDQLEIYSKDNFSLSHAKGLSAASYDSPDRPREMGDYLTEFLNPAIKMGEIGDGIQTKFDDRKFRFDDAIMSEDGKMLFIKLGMTHYKECEDCRKWDEKTRGRMIRKGETQFQDPNAYFSRGCGIAVTPITSNGHIFIGKRKVQDPGSGYAGALAAVNGWIDYPWNQINTNPDPIIKVDFRVDAFREMKEEFGINPTDVDSLIFSGVVSAPNRADTDFVYLAPLKISDEEFLARYSKRQDREHEDLVQIVNYSSKMELLETGRLSDSRDSFEVLYSLRFSLEQIKSTEMAV